jgi:fumarate reductase iron-sulfur subunit
MTDEAMINVRIRREDPGCGQKAFIQEYQVARSRARRVLDLLEYIQEEVDPTLAWRTHICRDTCCYGCWLMVDGKRSMACVSILKKEQGEILLEPTDDFMLIRDLAVDFSRPKERKLEQ